MVEKKKEHSGTANPNPWGKKKTNPTSFLEKDGMAAHGGDKKSSLRSLWPLAAFQARDAEADLASCSCSRAGLHLTMVPQTNRIVGSPPPLQLYKG